MNNSKTKKLTIAALFSALTAVLSQIYILIGTIPINLALLSIFLSGAILGWKLGAVSQLVYVLLGLVGVPVFAGFSGGFGIVIGPTGGYIVGYIIAALLTGIIAEKIRGNRYIVLTIAMLVGLSACYVLGTAWFMYVTATSLKSAISACVAPFILWDLLKIVFAVMLSVRLKKVLKFL